MMTENVQYVALVAMFLYWLFDGSLAWIMRQYTEEANDARLSELLAREAVWMKSLFNSGSIVVDKRCCKIDEDVWRSAQDRHLLDNADRAGVEKLFYKILEHASRSEKWIRRGGKNKYLRVLYEANGRSGMDAMAQEHSVVNAYAGSQNEMAVRVANVSGDRGEWLALLYGEALALEKDREKVLQNYRSSFCEFYQVVLLWADMIITATGKPAAFGIVVGMMWSVIGDVEFGNAVAVATAWCVAIYSIFALLNRFVWFVKLLRRSIQLK